MEKKLEEISKLILAEIRTFLKGKNLFDQNFDIELKLGKYSIYYKRESGIFDEIVDIPDELYSILKKYIIQINDLWKEEGEELEWEENRRTAEHQVDIVIDGNQQELSDVSDLEAQIKILKPRLITCIEKEDFEEASRLRDLIKKYESRIEESENK